jgi:antitoxin component YwqK of YwqJK toxin-antitoxin module
LPSHNSGDSKAIDEATILQMYYPNGFLLGKVNFKSNQLNGPGTIYSDKSENAVIWEGEFKENNMAGSHCVLRSTRTRLKKYEGPMFNGLYHGTGKEYWASLDKLKYDGNFSYGLYDGMGKLYYKSGHVKYRGKFTKGKKVGGGEAFYPNGKLYYSGNWSGDKPFGQNITLFHDNGKPKYLCTMKNGQKVESCISFSKDGDTQITLDSTKICDGVHYSATISIKGKKRYYGMLKDGIKFGQGILFREDGQKLYEGEFVAGLYDGQGILYQKKSAVYNGVFCQGLFHGKGSLYYPNSNLRYRGNFKRGKICDLTAEIYHSNGEVKYQGRIENDLKQGEGVLKHNNASLKFSGNFLDNCIDGDSVKIYDKNGKITQEGNFKNGYLIK